MLADMNARAQRVQETTTLLEDTSAKAGDEAGGYKDAIAAGAQDNKENAERFLDSNTSATEDLVLSDL